MQTYYFTFGLSHRLSDKFQPVVATDREQARMKMVEVHGTDYAFGYTQQEFQSCIERGIFTNLNPLEPIYAQEAI